MKGRLSRIQQWERLAREADFQPALIADLCPVSLRQLERFFADRFEQTPSQWARGLKCRLARQLIAEGWSNKAAAMELGFASESHFCHAFKQVYAASPQSFSRLYGDKNVALRQERRPEAIGPACRKAARR